MPVTDRQRLQQALENFSQLASASEMTRCLGVALQPMGPSGPA
jgi:hypothetical protein